MRVGVAERPGWLRAWVYWGISAQPAATLYESPASRPWRPSVFSLGTGGPTRFTVTSGRPAHTAGQGPRGSLKVDGVRRSAEWVDDTTVGAPPAGRVPRREGFLDNATSSSCGSRGGPPAVPGCAGQLSAELPRWRRRRAPTAIIERELAATMRGLPWTSRWMRRSPSRELAWVTMARSVLGRHRCAGSESRRISASCARRSRSLASARTHADRFGDQERTSASSAAAGDGSGTRARGASFAPPARQHHPATRGSDPSDGRGRERRGGTASEGRLA
jgi:hypothetical protein